MLKREILSGKFSAESRFPSDNALARRFGVGRQTVYRAVARLGDLGLVRRERGSGTYLTDKALRKSAAIGLIVPSFPKTEMFSALCREVSHVCQAEGRLLWFADEGGEDTTRSGEGLLQTVRKMIAERVSGVIFRPLDYADDAPELNRKIIGLLSAAHIPTVLVDGDVVLPPATSGLDVVSGDNIQIGQLLGSHALACGARKILFAYQARHSTNVAARLAGIRLAVLSVANVRVECIRLDADDGRDFRRVMRSFKPDAVLCAGDFLAVRILGWLEDVGKRVPDDVLLAGVDDIETVRNAHAALTTVHQPYRAIAQVAYETLNARMAHPNALARHVLLPCKLVVRGTMKTKSDLESRGNFKTSRKGEFVAV